MKTMVISGINLFEGGPLSVYYDCLNAIRASGINKTFNLYFFVHKKELFMDYLSMGTFIELPKSRKNYIYRLYYEYSYFKHFSKRINVDVWISLHDITPNVYTKKLYTYCHNPSPFLPKDLRNIKYSLKNVAFSYFYKYLYRINIKRNDAVIVQQQWIREKFKEMYGLNNIIVARPSIDTNFVVNSQEINNSVKKFIFPAFPRYFKNFEVICEACKIICNLDFIVLLTLDGSENAYSKAIYEKYSDIPQIQWIGLQPRENVFRLYNESDCLLFPSNLETWGLPISEFKMTGRDIILADLPYAHETLGDYNHVQFFNPNDAKELARKMKNVVQGTQKYDSQSMIQLDPPTASNWNELIDMLH